MNLTPINNTSFTAKFASYPDTNKEAVRKFCDNPVEQLNDAKYTALKAYDFITKSPEVQSKLERIPDEDQIVLTPYSTEEDSWLHSKDGVQINPTTLSYCPDYYDTNSSGCIKPEVEDLVLDTQNPKEIGEKINKWLDNIVKVFN